MPTPTSTPAPSRHNTGVSFGGLTTPAWTDADRAAQSDAMAQRAARFAQSPKGRFHAAAALISRATGDNRLLNLSDWGLDSVENRADAQAILNVAQGPAADQCRAALAEIVGQVDRVAA